MSQEKNWVETSDCVLFLKLEEMADTFPLTYFNFIHNNTEKTNKTYHG